MRGSFPELLNRRLFGTASVFRALYDDYQINQFVDLGAGQTSIQLRNAAQVSTYGGELGLSFAVTPALKVNLDLSYVHAEFDRFPDGGGPGIDLSGNRLPYAPRLSSAAGFTWGKDLAPLNARIQASANWSHRTVAFAGPENLSTQKIGKRDLLDARLDLKVGKCQLSLWARNLLNERYKENSLRDFFQTLIIERGEPRTFGLSLKAGIISR